MGKVRVAGLTLGALGAAGLVAGVALMPGATAETSKSQATGQAKSQVASVVSTHGQHGVDPRVEVPAGNKLTAKYLGKGVQVYQCTDAKWTLLEPAATLHKGRETIGLHSRGPVWVSTKDGSAVNAAAVPGAVAPVQGAVPEVLLKATATRGEGVFGGVSFVQRLKTRGGLAPTTACTNGAQTAVPYVADYLFYKPANAAS